MKPRHIRFEISFLLPQGATVADAREYVLGAVSDWCGSLKPPGADPEDPDGDPMFSLDSSAVKIKRLGPIKSRRSP